ncbi:tetratricopeptide repeat protein [Neofamilia massiliensis]|uniref:tetratricopeptide repeat protein n=1 Tax=Neofamilia massiliensis TaxID=1673724 RepID=UPI0006BB5524|nr:tetratricopeptide repeat protein [Neofamilia massiliensis]
MIYEKFLLPSLDDLAVLELKEGASIEIEDQTFKGYLPLPILNSRLVTLVQKDLDQIPLAYFVEGMIYYLSLSADDKYKDTYLDFVKETSKDIKGFVFKAALELMADENFLDALVYLNFLVKEDLADPKIYFTLGQALENLDISTLNDREKNSYAVEIMNTYERVLNLDPSFSLAYYKLAYIYRDFGQYIKAKLVIEKFLQLDKNDFRLHEARLLLDDLESEIKKEEAVVDINAGAYEEAMKKLMAVNVEKRDDIYFYNLSICYYYLGLFEDGIDAIKRSLEIEESPIYKNQLALFYQQVGSLDLARKELEEAIDTYGPDYFLNYNLATIQYQTGFKDAALGNFEIAYDIDPNPDLGNLIEQLKK